MAEKAEALEMSLLIQDKEVEKLALQLQSALQAPSLEVAVRTALEHEILRLRPHGSFEERISRALAIADAMGPTDPEFDMKAFSDDLGGEE